MLFKQNERIIFFGDSITDASKGNLLGEGAPISNYLGSGYVNLLFGYFYAKHPNLHLRFVNKGTSGHRTWDLINRIDKDIIDEKADWVVIFIGINDIWRMFDAPNMYQFKMSNDEYENNIRFLVDKSLDNNIKVILCSPYFIEPNKKEVMRAKTDEYVAIVEKVAKEKNVPFVNVQKAFDKVLKDITNHEIARDRIHPNVIGHSVIAKAIIEVVEKG